MRVFTEAGARAALRMRPLIDALASAFRGQSAGRVTNNPRTRVIGGGGGTLQLMSAGWRDADTMDYKAYTTSANGVEFLVLLYDGAGRPLATFEADALGALRTGAASGLATRHMARANASAVAILGSGAQARTQLTAVCALRDVRRATVFSRTPANRDRFAEEMSATLGIPVTSAATAAEVTARSDILCVITTARDPVLAGRWLGGGYPSQCRRGEPHRQARDRR
ncbi:MAG: ornithine cyclodeaminase family protein [Armatimonadetes bacterium]|nr:ornithine cyclodeaminase family protein [Armatimonadota bacterium]